MTARKVMSKENEAVQSWFDKSLKLEMPDKWFFETLNLHYKRFDFQDALESIYRGYSTGNWIKAFDALRKFIANRPREFFEYYLPKSSDVTRENIHVAEEALKDRYIIDMDSSEYVDIPSPGHLSRIPLEKLSSDGAGRYLMHISHVINLLDVATVTKNSRYAEKAFSILDTIYEEIGGYSPVARHILRDRVEERYGNKAYLSCPWLAWSIGERVKTWPKIIALGLKNNMKSELMVKIMKLFLEDLNDAYPQCKGWGGNFPQFHLGGVLLAALDFDFFDGSSDWAYGAALGMVDNARAWLLPDGSCRDLSWTYTSAYLIFPAEIFRKAKIFGSREKLEEILKNPIYEKLAEWLLYMLKPNGRVPAFNDSGPYDMDGTAIVNKLEVMDYCGRDDLRKIAAFYRTGKSVNLEHASYPFYDNKDYYSGMYVMRSGWDKSARYGCIDFGPYGTWPHGNDDYGSFCITAYGRDFVVDPGVRSYDSPFYHAYYHRDHAHNLLRIDGKSVPPTLPGSHTQGRYVIPVDNDKPHGVKPAPAIWITNSQFDMAGGGFDFSTVDKKGMKEIIKAYGGKLRQVSGYTMENIGAGKIPASWQRILYFAKPDYFLLIDKLEGKEEHIIWRKLQLAPDLELEVKNNHVVASTKDGRCLCIYTIGEQKSPKVIKGYEKDGKYQGWVADAKFPMKGIASPALIYEEKMKLPALLPIVLYPSGDIRCPLVKSFSLSEDNPMSSAFSVELPGRYKDFCSIGKVAMQNCMGGWNIQADGNLLHVRFNENNQPENISFWQLSGFVLKKGNIRYAIKFGKSQSGFIKKTEKGGWVVCLEGNEKSSKKRPKNEVIILGQERYTIE